MGTTDRSDGIQRNDTCLARQNADEEVAEQGTAHSRQHGDR